MFYYRFGLLGLFFQILRQFKLSWTIPTYLIKIED